MDIKLFDVSILLFCKKIVGETAEKNLISAEFNILHFQKHKIIRQEPVVFLH